MHWLRLAQKSSINFSCLFIQLVISMNQRRSLIIQSAVTITLLSGLTACGFQEYIAKPIDKTAITEKIINRRVDDSQFIQYLAANGYEPEQLPIKEWSPDDLVYCGLFFNPSLNVARAQWRSAEAAKMTASDYRLPTLNTKYGKSNNANDELSPHTYTLSIDIPIETAGKRSIRIESAAHLSEAAKLRIAQSAWQVRSDILRTVYEYQYNEKLISLLTEEQTLRKRIVGIIDKRLSLGESSKVELSKANLYLQEITTELDSKLRYQTVLQARLANNLGITPDKLNQMKLTASPDAKALLNQAAPELEGDLQSKALVNRLDLRMALARYAAAEAKVKLEIARQYPDINLTPNYTYEFGNKIWALGLSGLMTIITKNKMAIAEAKELREVEAAQFETLQNNVIAEVYTAKAKLNQAKQMLDNQDILLAQQTENALRVAHKLQAGEADRLELTYANLEKIVAEKNHALANYQLAITIQELENVLQSPVTKTRANIDSSSQQTPAA